MLLQIITPFNIYFNARLIYQKWEVWRLLTNFLFFGSLGRDFLVHSNDSRVCRIMARSQAPFLILTLLLGMLGQAWTLYFTCSSS